MVINNRLISSDSQTNNIEDYAIIINKLKPSTNLHNGNIPILFDESIKFIHPLFLIHILNFYEFIQENHSEMKILLDITNIDKKLQAWILNYLAQYIDYEIIRLVFKKKTDVNNYKEPTISVSDKSIILYHSTYENYKNTNVSQRKQYNYLPITKITKFKNELIRYSDNVQGDDNSYRKEYYDFLQVDETNEKIYKDYRTYNLTANPITNNEFIWNIIFDTYLSITKLDDKDTMHAFKNILFECVDNIKKHTQSSEKKANGYIAFYKNKKDSKNEFIIFDDYEIGFVANYLEVLQKEKQRLINLHTERIEKYKKYNPYYVENVEEMTAFNEIVSNYDKDIKRLETNTSENDIQILEELFNKTKIPQMHQAGRMIMHFGIPTLINLLDKLDVQSSQLDVYVHRGKRSYCISYKNNKLKVIPLDDNSVKGTYIYLSFPLNAEIKTIKYDEPLDIKIESFANTFSRYSELKRQRERFYDITYDDLKNDVNKYEMKKSLYITYPNQLIHINISDFLREIYRYTYKYNIKDVLIENFPTKNYENYLSTLIDILYPNENSKYKNDTLNIAFLDNIIPKIIFIGGKNKKELEQANFSLSRSYNYYKENFTKTSPDLKNFNINSNLFYSINKKERRILPFELFKNSENKYVFTSMINNYLESSDGHKDIHVDTGNEIHLKKFYCMKDIFEDSHWVDRIAFALANEVNDNLADKNIVFVGSWKYSSQIISLSNLFLKNNNQPFIIYNKEDDLSRFKEFVLNKKDKKYFYVFFTSVILDGKHIDEFLSIVQNSCNYSAIQVYYNNNYNKFTPFLKKDISHIIESADKCSKCFTGQEKPLYQLDEDQFTIRNLFHEPNYDIKIENQYKISWKNSIIFGHVDRGVNHYLYYTKTIAFFWENFEEIKKFLFDIKSTITLNETSVILCPINETNQEFITLVKEIIFDNNVIIHYFNLTNKEQNLYNINSLKSRYSDNMEKYNFYFIDDEISSQSTLEYFKTLLHAITNKELSFSNVFAIIDRTSNDNDFKVFTKLAIKPIKTGVEECYLCTRKDFFNELMNNSSLVFAKQQFRRKMIKISKIKATDIEYKKETSKEDLKNYLKMSAVEYIYKNFHNLNSLTDIGKHIKKFKDESIIYLSENYKNNEFPEEYQYLIDKIVKYESKIAFIKALSFPKILYFENIRTLVHSYIIEQLTIITDKIFDLENKLIHIEEFYSNDEYEIIKKHFEIFEDYNIKTNIDYINFLITTSAYLNMNQILRFKMIEFFYFLSLTVRDRALNIQLLHTYPTAVKMITSYSKSKSLEFESELKTFIKFYKSNLEYNKSFSLIFALYIENTKFLESKKDDLKSMHLDENITFIDNENNIKKFINKVLGKEPISTDLYIDINQHNENPKLINIFDNFSELKDKDSLEYLLFKGATTKQESPVIDLKLNIETENEYNIWCNYFKKIDNTTGKTLIRITEIDNEITNNINDNPFKPIAIIVIKHFNNIEEHLEISRRILMIQNSLITFMEEKNLLSTAISEYVHNLEIEKSKGKQEVLENYFKNHGHGVGKLIGFDKILNQQLFRKTILNDLNKSNNQDPSYDQVSKIYEQAELVRNYAYGLPFIVKAAQLGVDNREIISDKQNFFSTIERMQEQIILFLESAHIESHCKINQIKYEIVINKPNNKVNIYAIDKEELKAIIFEFCNNAGKHNNLESTTKCQILFSFNNNCIIIENNKNGRSSNSGTQVGINTIKNFLKNKDCEMTISDLETKFRIEINIEGNNNGKYSERI